MKFSSRTYSFFRIVEPHLVLVRRAGTRLNNLGCPGTTAGGVAQALSQHNKLAGIGGLSEHLGRTFKTFPHEYLVSRDYGLALVIEAGARRLVGDGRADVGQHGPVEGGPGERLGGVCAFTITW